MSGCNAHFFGGSTEAESAIEKRLARPLAASAQAASTTFRAIERWERAYIADIEGQEEAIEHYEECLDLTRTAYRQWKQVENEKSELIAFLISGDRDARVRPSVRDEIAALNHQEMLGELRDDGRFFNVPIEESDDMADYARELFGIDDEEAVESVVSGREFDDDGWGEIIRMFSVDLHAVQRIKARVAQLEQSLLDAKEEVEAGRLFESLNYSLHKQGEIYPVSRTGARVTTTVSTYMTWVDTYGGYIMEALTRAEDRADEIWPELDDQLWPEQSLYLGEDPVPEEGPATPESGGTRTVTSDD